MNAGDSDKGFIDTFVIVIHVGCTTKPTPQVTPQVEEVIALLQHAGNPLSKSQIMAQLQLKDDNTPKKSPPKFFLPCRHHRATCFLKPMTGAISV